MYLLRGCFGGSWGRCLFNNSMGHVTGLTYKRHGKTVFKNALYKQHTFLKFLMGYFFILFRFLFRGVCIIFLKKKRK